MNSNSSSVLLEIKNGFAVISFNVPHKLNAMNTAGYKQLTAILNAVDKREDVFCTVLTGKGTFFSAGADVKARRDMEADEEGDVRTKFLGRAAEMNLDLARALYRHTKLLVAALNGPAIGLSAGILGWFDFIYAVENAYILTPFSTLSLVAEGGASLSFPRRMGISKANEALIMGKKLGAAELQANGFFNKIWPQSSDTVFLGSVLSYLTEKFADLDPEAMLVTKQLIRSTLPDPDPANVREIFAAAERLSTGKPQAEFARIAAKQKKHKL